MRQLLGLSIRVPAELRASLETLAREITPATERPSLSVAARAAIIRGVEALALERIREAREGSAERSGGFDLARRHG